MADDGKRPYDPLMPHDDTTSLRYASLGGQVLQENDYFFESAEDTVASTGFYFPEMQWDGYLSNAA